MKDDGYFAADVCASNGESKAELECRDDDIYVSDNGTDTGLEKWLNDCFNPENR